MARVEAAQDRLRALLASARNADGGWPYYDGRKSRIEPTCWAILALGDANAAALLAHWRDAGGIVVEPDIQSANYTFNALAALALAAVPPADAADAGPAIAAALLAHHGEKVSAHPAIRQNPNLQGWSWTDGTFSWVEPTSWCTLAVKKLARQSKGAPARIDEAEKVLYDRVCTAGGWNYGHPEVYGQNLPPHIPPTAVGILALQDRRNDPIVRHALEFLMREGVREGSTTALSLSWLAAAAVGAPSEAFAGPLVERLPVTESLGNLASAAMMLYVLRHHERQSAPSEVML